MAETRAKSGLTNQQIGIAIAVILHIIVIGLLSVQWTAGERRFDNPPMEVDLIAEVAPQSTAPVISDTPPAARLGEEDAFDTLPPVVVPTPPLPEPVVRPRPVPAKKLPPATKRLPPKAVPKTPPKQASRGPTGRLDGITDGLTKTPPKVPPKQGAPAAATAAEVKKSIDVSIKSAVSPRWNGCRVTGVDIEQLKTVVKFRLSQSGALAGFTSVTTSGDNDSNKFQVQRHQECAKRAIELAAPFDLPAENYSFWQNYTLDFIKR